MLHFLLTTPQHVSEMVLSGIVLRDMFDASEGSPDALTHTLTGICCTAGSDTLL